MPENRPEEIIPVVAAVFRERPGSLPSSLVMMRRKWEGADEEGIPRSPELLGKWEFPGGMMRYLEAPEAALRREVYEELGSEVKVEIGRVLHVGSYWYDDRKHYLVIFYDCFNAGGKLPRDCRWFSFEAVRGVDCLPGCLEVVELLEAL